MKVWVVTYGEGMGSTDVAWLLGVFSTKEGAETFAAETRDVETNDNYWKRLVYNSADVHEAEIDVPIARPKRLV